MIKEKLIRLKILMLPSKVEKKRFQLNGQLLNVIYSRSKAEG
jgi:hypothetical protein